MNDHDKALIEQARRKRWEDIDENEAETADGKRRLHRIIMGKYHREEWRNGML